jgi:hypothetical protein
MDVEETYAVSCFYELFLKQLRLKSQAVHVDDDFNATVFGLAEKLLLKRKLITDEIVTNLFSLFIVFTVMNSKNVACLNASLLFLKQMVIVI